MDCEDCAPDINIARMRQIFIFTFLLVTMSSFVYPGIVKRDTSLDEVGRTIVNSVKDLVGIEADRSLIEYEDIKIEVIYLVLSSGKDVF